MLISIFIAWLAITLGGEMPKIKDDLHEAAQRIKHAVSDHERRDQALAILKQMEDASSNADVVTKAEKDNLEALASRRESTPAEFTAALVQPRARIETRRQRLFALRTQLKGVLNREEWVKVFPPPTDQEEGAK